MTDNVFNIILQTLLAVCGAIARQLHTKSKKAMKIKELLSGCFVAGFTGVLIYLVTHALKIEGDWAYFAAAVSGWLGPQVIDKLISVLGKKTGLGDILAADGKETQGNKEANEQAQRDGGSEPPKEAENNDK
jgi:hypothetical protein